MPYINFIIEDIQHNGKTYSLIREDLQQGCLYTQTLFGFYTKYKCDIYGITRADLYLLAEIYGILKLKKMGIYFFINKNT